MMMILQTENKYAIRL